jgi:hypothetical protein
MEENIMGITHKHSIKLSSIFLQIPENPLKSNQISQQPPLRKRFPPNFTICHFQNPRIVRFKCMVIVREHNNSRTTAARPHGKEGYVAHRSRLRTIVEIKSRLVLTVFGAKEDRQENGRRGAESMAARIKGTGSDARKKRQTPVTAA